jgi:predicted glycosyltransferase
MKRVIFDIGHPAQVHNFKYIYWELKRRGWEGLFVTKDKEICIYLLEKYNLPFRVLSKNRKGILKKILFLSKDIFRFYRILEEFEADIVINRISLHSTLVSKLTRTPQISIADTEKSLNPTFLTDYIFTSTSFKKDFGKKHFRYRANIELFYLHKNWFKPDKRIFKLLGIDEGEEYVIIRFVSWNAHHDIGQKGFSYSQKLNLVRELSKRVKVFISSEIPLPEELKEYQITIPPEEIHSALYFANIYIGEGGTMASESAILGTPAIYVNSLNGAGVFLEEEEAGLLYRITDGVEATNRAVDIIDNESKEIYLKRREEYLKDKIDVTSYMVWVIENFPKSIEIIKENPNYQERFK